MKAKNPIALVIVVSAISGCNTVETNMLASPAGFATPLGSLEIKEQVGLSAENLYGEAAAESLMARPVSVLSSPAFVRANPEFSKFSNKLLEGRTPTYPEAVELLSRWSQLNNECGERGTDDCEDSRVRSSPTQPIGESQRPPFRQDSTPPPISKCGPMAICPPDRMAAKDADHERRIEKAEKLEKEANAKDPPILDKVKELEREYRKAQTELCRQSKDMCPD